MIGVDWGTTSFRAFRITQDGAIRDRRSGPRGIPQCSGRAIRRCAAGKRSARGWLAGKTTCCCLV